MLENTVRFWRIYSLQVSMKSFSSTFSIISSKKFSATMAKASQAITFANTFVRWSPDVSMSLC